MRNPFKNPGEGHNAWQSYADLMAGLVIFFLIASIGYLVNHDEGRKIKAIMSAQSELCEKSEYFRYNEEYHWFECKVDVVFDEWDVSRDGHRPSEKHWRIPDEASAKLIKAGSELHDYILRMKREYQDVEYEILIDGRISGNFDGPGCQQLSYMRAYSLYELWHREGLFDNKVDNIHAAGSSSGGRGRTGDVVSDRTFKIQVIPYLTKD